MKNTFKKLCLLFAVCISASSASALTLKLKALIEGRFNGSTTSPSMVSDAITVELRSNIAPYALIESQIGILNCTGAATISFTTNGNGPYFIAVKHRNSIETWSNTAKSPVAGVLTYDFTTANTQAYGRNLKLKGGKYCIYSADVNQDGNVDAADMTLVDIDASNWVEGYAVTDLNGDLFVDANDLTIVDNNKYTKVIAVKPGVSIPLTLNLTALIEGLYNGSVMKSDDILVEIHNSAAPYALVASANATLNTAGKAKLTFTGTTINTNYYIVVKHRNSIETWSKIVSFVCSTISYDFTTSILKAYGNNLKLTGGKYCIFSGDPNQDGKVDATDLTLVDNDALNFTEGYVVTDIDGNLYVDSDDETIIENNKITNVVVKRPFTPTTLTLNLTALIEGFYNGSTNIMVSDAITVELRSNTAPYGKVATSVATLSTAGTADVKFTGAAIGGSYYIVVKHRNSIETWSKGAVAFSSSASYNFTTAQLQAFEGNMNKIGTRWCLFSGDVNQDGFINATDETLVSDDYDQWLEGHVVTDLNGDLTVEILDLAIVYNNKTKNVIVKRPAGAKNLAFEPIESSDVSVNTVSFHPNPMIGNELNFNVTAHENDLITITLNDVQGRKVADLSTNSVAEDGLNLINTNLNDLESGIYFYRATINNESFTGKVIKK